MKHLHLFETYLLNSGKLWWDLKGSEAEHERDIVTHNSMCKRLIEKVVGEINEDDADFEIALKNGEKIEYHYRYSHTYSEIAQYIEMNGKKVNRDVFDEILTNYIGGGAGFICGILIYYVEWKLEILPPVSSTRRRHIMQQFKKSKGTLEEFMHDNRGTLTTKKFGI